MDTFGVQVLLASQGVKKVFMYAYMRGGSTLLYEIFNHDPKAIAWYEPLGALYAHLYGLPQFRHYRDIVYEEGQMNTEFRY